MQNRYTSKFRTPKGLLVYAPTDKGRATGQAISKRILSCWSPPTYFFHFRRGGHVAAARRHLNGKCFARLDIASFFDSVTRSKLHRALLRLRLPHAEAWDIVVESTVKKDGGAGYSLPFGFVQSPVLSSVAIDRSALGTCFRTARRCGVRLSVYVDDILISAADEIALRSYVETLQRAAIASAYTLNEEKCEIAVPMVEAFNLHLSNNALQVAPARMRQFELVDRSTDLARETAIVGYVRTVNRQQAAALKAFYGI